MTLSLFPRPGVGSTAAPRGCKTSRGDKGPSPPGTGTPELVRASPKACFVAPCRDRATLWLVSPKERAMSYNRTTAANPSSRHFSMCRSSSVFS